MDDDAAFRSGTARPSTHLPLRFARTFSGCQRGALVSPNGRTHRLPLPYVAEPAWTVSAIGARLAPSGLFAYGTRSAIHEHCVHLSHI